MLLNLVLNALREISSGGTVRLTGMNLDGQVRLVVADDGPGMPSETVSKVFDPMFSTSKNGCGLGLPIVQRIVESHKGTISVASSQSGTCFEILLDCPASDMDNVTAGTCVQSAGGYQ